MHFPEKFCPYISFFDKVTALLILWEFDRGITGKFHNDVIGRSRDLLKILVFDILITFSCNFAQIEVIGKYFECRTELSPP